MTQTTLGKVEKLFISQNHTAQTQEVNSITVDEKGIKESKFYNKKLDRSVLLSSLHAYALCRHENIDIAFGELGENLLLDFNPHTLALHSKLSIGTAILELTIPCTLCKGLFTIDKALPILLEHDRGVFFKVIQEGIITRDDSIILLTP